MPDWRDERDEFGFPLANEDREGEFYLDEFDIVWQCRFVAGMGWAWVTLPGDRGGWS